MPRLLLIALSLSLAVAIAFVVRVGFQEHLPGAPSPDTPGAPGAPPVWEPVREQTLQHGRFGHLRVYAPHAAPRGFVLLLSGDGGWTASLATLAHALAAQQGALVVGIDGAALAATLEADPADCVFPDGDLENLSHFVQAYYRLPTYLWPIVAGDAAGGAMAYAVLTQAPPKTFSGALSLQFCPVLHLRKRLCKSAGYDAASRPGDAGVDLLPDRQLTAPWVVVTQGNSVLQGVPAPPAAVSDAACDAAAVQRFVAQVPNATLVTAPAAAAFEPLIARQAPSPAELGPRVLADLPIVSVPAMAGATPSDTFAILLSGDGGWAGLDKDVAAALTAKGLSVVGLDSLRYFWTARTPDGLAHDLERMIRYYVTELGKQRVVLIGYSQGADVLPFAVNRLSAATRAPVALMVIIGMSEHALFEFHLSSWVADDQSGPATLPEVARITGIPRLCIYGEGESDSLCPHLDPHQVRIVELPGGHHFGGDYAALATTILTALQQSSGTTRR